MPKIYMSRYFVLMAAVLVAQLLIVILNPSTIDGHLNALFIEDGPIEALSPIGYGLRMVLIVALGGVRFAFTRAWSLMAILLVMMLRELDFHARFTTMNITKSKFFLSGEVPLHEKVVAFVALTLIGLVVLHVIFTYGRAFIAGLKRLAPVSVATALSILMIVLSEGLDGIGSRLAAIGFPIDPQASEAFEKMEETAEMGISLFAALAILAYFSARNEKTGAAK